MNRRETAPPWKAGRRFEMAKHIDAMAVIFPFEVKSFADTSLPVEFVGHPFVADDYESPVRYDGAGPVLLLPGSRRQSVARIFPAILEGYGEFAVRHPDRAAVVLSGPVKDSSMMPSWLLSIVK